jgi:DHA2 family multidrug resistance protein-like MFS transporter
VLLLVLGPMLLPEFRDPKASRLDLFSAALSLVAVLAMIYGLKQIAENGLGWIPALPILAGLAVGALFLRRQAKLADPLIDLRLFHVPAFNTSLATNALAIFVMGGSFLFIAQYLQLVLGLSPLGAGLWSAPSSGGFIVGSLLAPVMVRRIRPAFVMVGGLALAAAGFGVLTQADGASGLAVVVTASVIEALGVALVVPLSTDMIVGTAPPERAGSASALSETGAEFGGALGIAVLGSIGAAVYRSAMAEGVPDGIAPAAAEAARGTLGGAVATAGQLPDELAVVLLDTAREAFVQGLQWAALTCSIIMVGLAILVMAFLRHVRPGGEAGNPAETGATPMANEESRGFDRKPELPSISTVGL